MLDTIAIKLGSWDYKILLPHRFTPNAAILNNPAYAGNRIMRCHYNPTKKEKEQRYLPCLTLFKRFYGGRSATWLKVEFSAPKLIFGNNFEELLDTDFDKIVTVLIDALMDMGVEVSRKALINAKVTAMHYSKNIVLDRHTPCFLLIRMLEKVDMSKRLDISQSLFRNGGQMVKYHASTYEIVLYDKNKDFEQAQKYGERRGAETDYDFQRGIPNGCLTSHVLRMEV